MHDPEADHEPEPLAREQVTLQRRADEISAELRLEGPILPAEDLEPERWTALASHEIDDVLLTRAPVHRAPQRLDERRWRRGRIVDSGRYAFGAEDSVIAFAVSARCASAFTIARPLL